MLLEDTVVTAPALILTIEVVYLGASSHGTEEMAGSGTERFGVIKITFNSDLAIGVSPPAKATLS